MTKNELINDMSFRQKCGKYGLDWNNFKIYYVDDDEYVILLYTQRNDNYVLFDKNYNTICTKRTDWCKTEIGTFRFVVHEYSKYSTNTYTYLNGENMGYPFEDYTLKNFVDISNRIEIMEINHGHSIDIKINGEWYNDKQNNDYLQLV